MFFLKFYDRNWTHYFSLSEVWNRKVTLCLLQVVYVICYFSEQNDMADSLSACDSFFFFSLKTCHLAGCLPTCIYAVDYFCLSALSFTCLCWLHLIFSNHFLQFDKMLLYYKESTPSRYDIIWESFFSLPCFSGVLYFGEHSNNSIAKPVRTYQCVLRILDILNICLTLLWKLSWCSTS